MLLCSIPSLLAQNLPEGVIMPDKPNYAPYVDYNQKESGFWAGLDLGAAVSLNVDQKKIPSVTSGLRAVAGYRFNSFIMIGAGAGVNVYALEGNRVDSKHSGNRLSFPVFFNARGVMMSPRSRVTLPCWSMDIGYSFLDGFYLSPMLGIRVGGTERNHFIAGLAYALQGADLKVEGTTSPGFLHSVPYSTPSPQRRW